MIEGLRTIWDQSSTNTKLFAAAAVAGGAAATLGTGGLAFVFGAGVFGLKAADSYKRDQSRAVTPHVESPPANRR